jgi:RNA recognition motif-containing protein
MSKKLYVGNLSYQVDDEVLREAFAKIGEVQSARVIKDAETGRSRGFGFVEMADADAEKAITQLNGTNLLDRAIIVSEAKPQAERGGRGGGRGPSRGGFDRSGRGGFNR